MKQVLVALVAVLVLSCGCSERVDTRGAPADPDKPAGRTITDEPYVWAMYEFTSPDEEHEAHGIGDYHIKVDAKFSLPEISTSVFFDTNEESRSRNLWWPPNDWKMKSKGPKYLQMYDAVELYKTHACKKALEATTDSTKNCIPVSSVPNEVCKNANGVRCLYGVLKSKHGVEERAKELIHVVFVDEVESGCIHKAPDGDRVARCLEVHLFCMNEACDKAPPFDNELKLLSALEPIHKGSGHAHGPD